MKKLFKGAALLAVLIGLSSLVVSCGSSNSPGSPAATPTATFTPTSNNHVLFIYGSNITVAGNFSTLINANGYIVTSVAIGSLTGVNYGSYGIIVIGNDTASTSPWGSTAIVNAIKASAVPVLGLGAGGAFFFDTAGDTQIGYGDCQNSTGTTIAPLDTISSLWTTPNGISTSTGVVLYSSSSSV